MTEETLRSRNELIVKTHSGRHNPAAMQKSPDQSSAFTLIELLVVIAIIAILIGLLFPAFKAVQNQAKQTQAKNDLTQIVNAVNAYYTDYGKYPPATDDVVIPNNSTLFNVLRAAEATPTYNPRQIVFISPPYVKDTTRPRSGIGADGKYYDPWGTQYQVAIDTGYDNQMANPYSLDAGPTTLGIGVIAWSFGSDQQSQSVPGPAPDKNTGVNSDDVISWQ
jgi:prepilin-type N-terminal cleavage/methylation domain-containing protein